MIKPLNGWIIIEPIGEDKQEQTTSGGIIIQRQHNTPETRLGQAKVLSISELFHEGKQWETELKEGDIVVYEKGARQKHKNGEGEDVYMVREVDIYLVIEKD